MKKIMILLLILSLAMSVFVAPIAYADEVNYSVVFHSSDTSFTTQSVVAGGYAVLPSTPTKVGHTFKGWSLSDWEASVQPILNVQTYAINSNVEFYAVFEPIRYQVTFKFYNDRGLETLSNSFVEYNNVAVVPSYPATVNGSTFTGWDLDTSAPITANTIFTAQYSETVFVISYYDQDGELLDARSLSGFEDLTEYEIPEVEGFSAEGWSLSKNGTPIKSTFRADSDTVLYAVYSKDYLYWYANLKWYWQAALAGAIAAGVGAIIKLLFGRRRARR